MAKIEIHLPPRFFRAAFLAAAGIALVAGLAFPELARSFLLLLGIALPGAIVFVGLMHTIDKMEHPDPHPEPGWVGAVMKIDEEQVRQLMAADMPIEQRVAWLRTYGIPYRIEGRKIIIDYKPKDRAYGQWENRHDYECWFENGKVVERPVGERGSKYIEGEDEDERTGLDFGKVSEEEQRAYIERRAAEERRRKRAGGKAIDFDVNYN